MLAATLRRYRGNRAFHDLQQRLLHAFTRHVPRDRRVVGLARDLVDLVDIDDAALCALDIVIGRLQKLQDDVLDILADIAGFGKGGGIRHREGNIKHPRQRLRQQRLAASGRADKKDVRLRNLHIAGLAGIREALVMIVNGNGQNPLRARLADHIFVEDTIDIGRRRHAVMSLRKRGLVLLADDVHAKFDAFIADEHGRSGDQFPDFVLALSAERTEQRALITLFGL